jgi:putative SOS response-associated peptidase YedK
MCGRFTQAYAWRELYRLTCPPVNIEPRYDIAPTGSVSV